MERPPRRRRTPASLLLTLLAGAGCGTEPPPEPTAIDINGPSERLQPGATFRFTSNVSGSGGPLPDATVTWESRDTSSVKVDATGLATAARPGESWVVATAGQFKDSALVEVVFAIARGEARARVRTGGKDVTVGLIDPLGIQLDVLGNPDQTFWGVFGENAAEDTLVSVYFASTPGGARTNLQEVAPDADPVDTRPYAYLDIDLGSSFKSLAVRGWVEAGVDQAVPAGFRIGRMRMRMIGFGRFYTGTPAATIQWTQTQEAVDLVSDMLPDYLHDQIGSSWGQLTGTAAAGSWQSRSAGWGSTTARGRRYLVTVAGATRIQLYLPGTSSVDIGTEAETTKAFVVLTNTAAGYNATGTSGRVDVTTYRAPTSDLYGEIRAHVTVSGTGTTAGGAPTPFSGIFDVALPIYTATQQAAPAAFARAAPLVDRMRGKLFRR